MLGRSGILSVILAVCLLALAPSSAWPAGQDARVVSAEWLHENMNRPDVRILDVRASVADYWQSHVPGAVYMSPELMRLSDRGVPNKLMPPEALVILLGKLGISPGTMVVAYSEKGDFKPTYLMWALDYLGHKRSAVVEGGFAKWQNEGLPTTQDYPRIAEKRYPAPRRVHPEVRASLDETRRAVSSGDAVILDVRATEMYTGEKGTWKRKGHIKGALSRFWGEDLDTTGVWKDEAELRAAYERLGVTPDRRIITSCGQGQMSSHTYFTLKYILGYPDVRNYDGSFNEWSNLTDLPVDTGMKP